MYDKKLLWRANLYIDETLNEDGTISNIDDWNDLNPWTSAQGNEWDIDYTALVAQDVDYTRTNQVNGGQFNIKPWTRPYDPNNITLFGQSTTTVFNAVAYSGGCSDAVMHFNIDLDYHAEALTANGESANRTNKTLAPGTDWSNYLTGTFVTGSNPANWTAPVIGGATRYPYRPVLTSVTGKTYNGTVLGYGTHQLGYSSGVDCYGHMQRIASYNGNNYALTDFGTNGDGNRLEWGQDNSTLYESLAGIRADSWLIEGITATNITNTTGTRNFIVPGDIITMDGHVAVITKIGFNASTRVIDPDNVFFIECTSPRGEWKIINNISYPNRHLTFFCN